VLVQRAGFDAILAAAVPSSFVPVLHPSQEAWKRDFQRSDVRLQWDPDHPPSGAPVARRAIQLGLRGAMLRRFAEDGGDAEMQSNQARRAAWRMRPRSVPGYPG
jgi:hypothetical protein